MMDDDPVAGESSLDDLMTENERLQTYNVILQIEIDSLNDRNEEIERGTDSVDQTKLVSILENEMTCVICDGLFIEPCTLPCGHTFCTHCIGQWLKTKLECPVCRERCVGMQKTKINTSVSGFIERIFTDVISLEDLQKKRVDALKKREEEVKKMNNVEAKNKAVEVRRSGRPRRRPRWHSGYVN